MIVKVNGAKDRDLTQLLKLAANSFAEKLISPQLDKNITLNIYIRDKLDAGGYCDFEEEGLPLPRTFNIDIQRTRKKIHMFSVLAHEMVHLKQMAKGEMKDRYKKTKYVTVWRGETYEDDISYWDQPWEIEAYGLENSLVAKFLIEHNQFKNLRQKQKDWFVYDVDYDLNE
jgi:hypothetical protein